MTDQSEGRLVTYSLSFTAGALLLEESRIAAQVLLDTSDSTDARKRLIEQRLISARTESAARRTVSEILSRLGTLSRDGLELVAHGNLDEAKQVLWIACCKRYPLIKNFAEGPLSEAANTPGGSIDSKAVEVFFLNEQSSHDELASRSEGTKYKLRQVLRLLLNQAGLINDSGTIIRGLAEPRVVALLESRPMEKALMGGLITR